MKRKTLRERADEYGRQRWSTTSAVHDWLAGYRAAQADARRRVRDARKRAKATGRYRPKAGL
jgi:hypothetical protein